MQFHENQERLAKSKARYIVVNAGRRFGKTTWTAYELLGCAISKDKNKVWYFGPTFDDARRIMWDTLCDISQGAILSRNESRLELTVATVDGGKSTISLFGWDRANNRRGSGVNLIVFDEVAFMRDFNHYWTTVFRPALLDTHGRAIFTSTPNGNARDWRDLYDNATGDDWERFHFTSYDNPLLPHNEIDKIKEDYQKKGKDNAFAQEYLAEFKAHEGLVYKIFNTQQHIRDIQYTPNKYRQVICGVDWGFVDPTCAVLIGELPNGSFEVFDEYKAYETVKADTIQALQSKHAIYNINRTYPDTADQDGFAMLAQSGLNPVDTDKSKGSVERGIDTIRYYLANNMLVVSENCQELIKAFSVYHYQTTGDTTKPDHEASDMLDALRYALHTHRPVVNRIKSINRSAVSNQDPLGMIIDQRIAELSNKRRYVDDD